MHKIEKAREKRQQRNITMIKGEKVKVPRKRNNKKNRQQKARQEEEAWERKGERDKEKSKGSGNRNERGQVVRSSKQEWKKEEMTNGGKK